MEKELDQKFDDGNTASGDGCSNQTCCSYIKSIADSVNLC